MKVLLSIIPFLLLACGTTSRIGHYAQQQVVNDSALLTAHVGISVYEPATGSYLYNYQGDKYFVPASNTKIPTCYAAMKYLGDSLVGLRYDLNTATSADGTTWEVPLITGTGDPTFLHPDFTNQPVYDFLNRMKEICFVDNHYRYRIPTWGAGWSINDYLESYMPERSAMPIYGNVVDFQLISDTLDIRPSYFKKNGGYKNRLYGARGHKYFTMKRSYGQNDFSTFTSSELYKRRIAFSRQIIPFVTIENSEPLVVKLLSDTLQKEITVCNMLHGDPPAVNKIHSQPTDSLLRPMMHRSDNFFAEQSLLMVSNERLQYMSDTAIIGTLLKTDFKDLPQKPRWADGSGLSRYNLFTPQDFVFILQKMKNEFGMARIKDILPTGGEGTLSNYYVADSTFIYAKTGTLSGVVALSGFLYTTKGKELIFSILVNNHQGTATAVRRAVERFVKQLRHSL